MAISKRQQFDRFARMILKGQSDIVYRAYDIESMVERVNRIFAYQHAMLVEPMFGLNDADCNMAMMKLQRDLAEEGYGVIPLKEVDKLVKMFWPYYRISNHYRKGRKRPPEETQRLYMQHLQSLADEHNAQSERSE